MQAREHTPPGVCPNVHNTTEAELVWTAPPAAHRAARAPVVLAFVVFTCWVAVVVFHSLLLSLVAALAILGSVAEALFPVHHRITPRGVFTRCAWQWRSLEWKHVRSARTGPDGVHLSPIKGNTRLSRMRGVTLRFAGGNNSAVLETVRRYYNGGEPAG